MNEKNKIQILIIDLGSQYTQIIRRSLRYLGFYSIILPPEKSLEWIKVNKPKGIILSGGSSSVYDIDAPKIPKEIVNLNIPILGICYGMQWLAYINDKDTIEVKKEGKSYGPVQINFSFKNKSKLFEKLKENINAWSSHGDSVKKAPKDFIIIATSQDGKVIEAIECEEKKLWAVQFHPEVEETQDENIILNNFVIGICNCEKDYSRKDVIEEIRKNTKIELGNDIAIIGVSGGVDSTTLAAILAPALGNKLKAFFIDTGGMRKGEIEKIKNIAQKANLNLEIIEKYKNKFINKIGMVIDAEAKRATFRTIYGEVFHEVAKSYGATYMIQGTLATDLIESGSGGKSVLIKTHHNVDLDLGLKEIMPLSDYFKFEIRELANEFGLDELVSKRQPFPGPGLYLRIIGVPVTAELLEMVREADAEVTEILEKYGLYNKISQTVVALLGTKTVGVKGDGRVYGYSFVVRTVETTDFMTVKGFYLPKEVCEEIISTLSRHSEIVRVFFDFTPKPPATTEFE
ncbi:glutamine-hydrolyzing GMP synthase [Candidatus Nomurabacteria bacterium CG_4_9_14_0_2_um_filter_32_10]|uniref:GMP synthase (glutamine-hydrolyzing) n=3 Tax=Candidatus Nomuraibacteriota TaxID=1752729 RepID=A0A2H0CGZ7_9BACT|nr:MAG: glutamine-hydrolyzing GMP synthase [Candidatus Nomurabacteria bacterium CG22_combo_CG10-13_8_21_14_all_32_8]PJC49253.1 MAG: glutamine-hydrolyzing GMP synthase [Candidatus Nomurabacteria bacterium CG_4_9_14_0_2_um_filter_32_10]